MKTAGLALTLSLAAGMLAACGGTTAQPAGQKPAAPSAAAPGASSAPSNDSYSY